MDRCKHKKIIIQGLGFSLLAGNGGVKQVIRKASRT